GWKAIVDQPVMRALVWLSVLINVASFMGPLYPALVRHNLHGGAGEYGLLEVATVIGAMSGGAVAGLVERRLGAGRRWAICYGIAGICVVGTAASPWLPLTALLLAVRFFSSTVGSVSLGALATVLTPDQYRGRVWGIKGALSVIAVPISTLIGGALADL